MKRKKNINHAFARGPEFVLDKGTQTHKDKSKFNRKEKHKKSYGQ